MEWTVEFSAEVEAWYNGLTPPGKAATDRIVARLKARGNMLRMPFSRSVGDGLFELRFSCENVARRITYVMEPERHVMTLTTFRKQRQNERAEILGARRAKAAREALLAAGRSREKGKKG